MKIHKGAGATLILFAFFLAGCGSDQSAVKRESPAAAPAQAAPDSSSDLAALLPAKDAVAGWGMSQESRFFNAGNLWEFIDGAADGYLAYGFQEVITSDYEREGSGDQAVVDVYLMKDPLNAFGIYTQELNPDSEFIQVGNEGYLGGTALNFWSGPYYVKITVFEEKDELKQEMKKLADYVAGRIPDPGSAPAQVSWFPAADMVPHSVKYIPKDVLGQSYLSNGFEARYKAGASEYKVVLVSAADPAAAGAALTRYREFISGGGKVTGDLSSPGDGGFSGEDGYYGKMIAVRSGAHLVIALGVPSDSKGNSLAAGLIGNIQ